MAPPDNPPSDEELLASHAAVLANGIERALGPWVVRCVVDRADAWQPGLGRTLLGAAEDAGRRAGAEVGPQVRALLALDVDAQPTGPLAVLRGAVRFPTGVLAEAGVPDVVRDEFAERAFPEDRYDLAPAAFADLDPALHEPGLVWGAAKAHVVLARRRAEGRR
ncbi:MAG TPA: hypothetical protein VNS19_05610 [Acidimicrobiales bacterium]|nr:hypothetical protein [Acidimicrobiales bacterium]